MALIREAGSVTGDRVPPQSVALEMAVLGGIMLGIPGGGARDDEGVRGEISPADVYRRAAEEIDGSVFYLDGHADMWRVMGELVASGRQPDSLTVLAELRARQDGLGVQLLNKIGGSGALMAMLNAVPTGANVENHVLTLKAKAISRRAIFELTCGIDALYAQEQPNEDVLARAVERLGVLQSAAAGDLDFAALDDSLAELHDALEARLWAVEEAAALGLGAPELKLGLFAALPKLQHWTGGLKPGQLWVIGARPGEFKTGLALDLARDAALHGTPVAFFSLEMNRADMTKRLICAQSYDGLDSLTFRLLERPEKMTAGQRALYDRARAELGQAAPIYFPRDIVKSLPAILSQARRLKRERGIGLVVVDYAQLLESGGRAQENRTLEVAGFSRGLKLLALELGLPVVLPAQLNRGGTAQGGQKARAPRLEDFRECDALSHDADVVIMNWLPEGPSEPVPGQLTKFPIEFFLRKNRNGPTGKAQALVAADAGRFEPAQWTPKPEHAPKRSDPKESE
jgi:replicative DNA helicase